MNLAKNPNMQDIKKIIPEIKNYAEQAIAFAKKKPGWSIAAVAAAVLWGMQMTGNLVTPANIKRYPPNSQEAKDLFKFASVKYGLPDWSEDPDLHYILSKESNGWVGRPNYTYGVRAVNKNLWPDVWAELKAGKVTTKSSATGLGQCLLSNAQKYYPDGQMGIGDPINEAVGLIRYIKDRYGSPAVARSVYGQIGEYTHAVTGKKCMKKFKEGY